MHREAFLQMRRLEQDVHHLLARLLQRLSLFLSFSFFVLYFRVSA